MSEVDDIYLNGLEEEVTTEGIKELLSLEVAGRAMESTNPKRVKQADKEEDQKIELIRIAIGRLVFDLVSKGIFHYLASISCLGLTGHFSYVIFLTHENGGDYG